jgi:hypothetical protein
MTAQDLLNKFDRDKKALLDLVKQNDLPLTTKIKYPPDMGFMKDYSYSELNFNVVDGYSLHLGKPDFEYQFFNVIQLRKVEKVITLYKTHPRG